MLNPDELTIDPQTGLLRGVRYAPSPNCDDRPDDGGISVLVVHAISLPPEHFGGPEIEKFFQNSLDYSAHPYFDELRDLRVSAHFLIRRSGEIIQFVPIHQRAWHAGESCCEGREQVNDFSVGVELEGSDNTPFEDTQYESLAQLTKALMTACPDISLQRIYGHCDIAPDRKTDPGPFFSWERFHTLCA